MFGVRVGFPGSSADKESARLQCRRLQFDSWVGNICRRRARLPTLVFLGYPCGSAGKESTCNVGDLGSIPGLGRSPGEGKGYPLQYCVLENSMDCIIYGSQSQTRLSDFQREVWLLCMFTPCRVNVLDLSLLSMVPPYHRCSVFWIGSILDYWVPQKCVTIKTNFYFCT